MYVEFTSYAQDHQHLSCAFIVNFEEISYVLLMFALLGLKKDILKKYNLFSDICNLGRVTQGKKSQT